MSKSRVLVMVGAVLLVAGGFMPWISAQVLYGVQGPAYEGIAIGWEGDGNLTAGAGLLLLLGALFSASAPRRGVWLAGVVLAALAALVVLLDFGQILKIAPAAGFFAAAAYGLYVTLAGALLALAGSLWAGIPARRQRAGEKASTPKA